MLGVTDSEKRKVDSSIAGLAAIRYDPVETQRSDVDLWQREITVRGKGSKARIVRIGHQAALTLDRSRATPVGRASAVAGCLLARTRRWPAGVPRLVMSNRGQTRARRGER
jgi:hypothetical protein